MASFEGCSRKEATVEEGNSAERRGGRGAPSRRCIQRAEKEWAQNALASNVAVVISDGGRRRRAYGLYHGDGVARDNVPDRIVIYRDTLRRDFGHDPDELREQVVRTVRHELAHHLGWDELGVQGLGL